MRNGDVYKINGLAKAGKSAEVICHYFRHKYSADEVMKFIPGRRPKAEKVEQIEKVEPKTPRRKARSKAKAS